MCERQTTKKYTSRNSPPYKANECCGSTKTGNDGQKYTSKADKNGVCRWAKSNSTADHRSKKVYYIHDNGGRPFQVTIVSPTTVEIRKIDDPYEDEDPIYSKVVKKYTGLDKIFIGKSPKTEMTKWSEGYGKEFDGNTVLLQLKPDRYVFIGDYIYEFTSPEPIEKFISPVGNNDVPYPVALTKHFIFFLLQAPKSWDEKSKSFKIDMIRKIAFPSGTDWKNPFREYYDMFYPKRGKSKLEDMKKQIPVKMIQRRL